jgi:hypothetical protein
VGTFPAGHEADEGNPRRKESCMGSSKSRSRGQTVKFRKPPQASRIGRLGGSVSIRDACHKRKEDDGEEPEG